MLLFCIIYLFYYEGGDTVNYFKGTKAIANLLEQDFEKGLAVLFNTDSYFNSWQSFNNLLVILLIICGRIQIHFQFLGLQSHFIF